MTESTHTAPLRVVIVGGGIAALESVLALHELARERLRVTLIAPESDFVMRPLGVAAPFSRGHVNDLPLAELMTEHSGRFLRGAVARVDAELHTVTLVDRTALDYDLLVLAQGARSVPAFSQAVTFGSHPGELNGILADLEQGWTRSVAFVVPAGCTWPLPLYELALMTAEAAWSMNMDRVALHLVTPERRPLEIFGTQASDAVEELLSDAGITPHYGVRAQIHHGGRIETDPGTEIVVDRAVALPVLEALDLDGIPASANGFIPVDDMGRISGLQDIYAVGDATDRPIKQGGLACQQADVTAAHIAARAGADVEVPPLRQVLSGRLLTGHRDHSLQRTPGDVAGSVTDEPLWWTPTKVNGKYLSPYLIAKDLVHLPARERPAGSGIDVHVPLTWATV